MTAHPDGATGAGNVRRRPDLGETIARLLGRMAEFGPAAEETAEELVGSLVGMYGDALAMILSERSDEELLGLARHPLLCSLFVLHGMHPLGVDERIEAALDDVRPYLGSHAGGVEYLGVGEDAVARLRLVGSCDGCPASTMTVKATIEGAVLAAAPEVAAIDVQGVEEDPGPTFVALGPTRRRPPAADPGPQWVELAGEIPAAGALAAARADRTTLLLAATDRALYAYGATCPGCDAELAPTATLAGTVVTCGSCARRYDVVHAGAGMEHELRLQPYPLLDEGGTWRVAVPAVAG